MSERIEINDKVEPWWIFSLGDNEWNGIRIGFFRKVPPNDTEIVFIIGEIDKRRIGPRVWDEITASEGWVKVKKIDLPTGVEISAALDAAIRSVVQNLKKEMFPETGDGPAM